MIPYLMTTKGLQNYATHCENEVPSVPFHSSRDEKKAVRFVVRTLKFVWTYPGPFDAFSSLKTRFSVHSVPPYGGPFTLAPQNSDSKSSALDSIS